MSRYSRKDYEAAAAKVGREKLFMRNGMCDKLVKIYALDNPRFDEARFREACRLPIEVLCPDGTTDLKRAPRKKK